MNANKVILDELANLEKTTGIAKPPRSQALVSIGEYPIKTLLKESSIKKETLPIFIEKSSADIYKWLNQGVENQYVLGFEDSKVDTHFWYTVLPVINGNQSLMENVKKYPIKTAIVISSIWDGVGSASQPALISKFKTSGIDSLSIALLPSKIQPLDAHFNAYASIQLSYATDGATLLLVDRDNLENYEGVDRKGEIIKGNSILNYLLEILVKKDLLVEEVSELSRSFDAKLFAPLVVTGASLKIYGSLENMLNVSVLKPLLSFDLSNASLLYVLLRMPSNLADKLSRTNIELSITNWFKQKTKLQSIHVTEPLYTQELNDRIDIVLLIGGFNTKLFADTEAKVQSLKQMALEKGLITDNWQPTIKVKSIKPKIQESTPDDTSLKEADQSEIIATEPIPNSEISSIQIRKFNIEEEKSTQQGEVAEQKKRSRKKRENA